MAVYSYTRFIKEQMNYSHQVYIRKIRIDSACSLLEHTNMSIEEILGSCDFLERYHFSKIFKKIKHITPTEYKKRFILT